MKDINMITLKVLKNYQKKCWVSFYSLSQENPGNQARGYCLWACSSMRQIKEITKGIYRHGQTMNKWKRYGLFI